MIKYLCIASHNYSKIKFYRSIFENKPDYKIYTLDDFKDLEITEPTEFSTTTKGNAEIKSDWYYEKIKEKNPFMVVLSDDTGLFVDALNGMPGVKTARFAPYGIGMKNYEYLLKQMEDQTNRRATMITSIFITSINKLKTHFTYERKYEIAESIVNTDVDFEYDKILIDKNPDGYKDKIKEMIFETVDSIFKSFS